MWRNQDAGNGAPVQGKNPLRAEVLMNFLRWPCAAARLRTCRQHKTFMDPFLQAAIEEAKKGLAAGGIPIGSVLVLDGKIIGRGHNQRVQHGSVIHHAEMNCLENAGRQKASVYARCTLYSTLSPCPMCSGAALLYKIPRVVVGENVTFQGPEAYVRSQGVQVEILNDPTCIQLMKDFIKARPELWNEDIGV
jgi:creatinine deaminase